MKKTFCMDLRLFDAGMNVHTTEGYLNTVSKEMMPYFEMEGLSEEMKTYYSDYLIDNAEPKLVHDQFGQKHPIPQNGGKTVQFRKYDPLPKLTEVLSEGVTPTGQTLNMSVVECAVHQYGGYVELSDLLLLTAVDNNLVAVTKLLGAQAGRTLDTITREVLCGGTNVQYGEDAVSARYLLVGGEPEGNHYLTVDCIKRAVRSLKRQNAEKIDGAYVGIIHPDCAYDLMTDLNWRYPYQYAQGKQLFEGEIGMLEGVRFVESSEAKVFHSSPICGRNALDSSQMSYDQLGANGNTTSGSGTRYRVTISNGLTNVRATPDLVGRSIVLYSAAQDHMQFAKVTGVFYSTNDNNYLYLDHALSAKDGGTMTFGEGDRIYSADAGFKGRDVYATLILGENAYGTTEISGGGLEHIVKQLGSAGTADPLNQRASVGWKATKAAVRLMEPFMVRIETASSFEEGI